MPSHHALTLAVLAAASAALQIAADHVRVCHVSGDADQVDYSLSDAPVGADRGVSGWSCSS